MAKTVPLLVPEEQDKTFVSSALFRELYLNNIN